MLVNMVILTPVCEPNQYIVLQFSWGFKLLQAGAGPEAFGGFQCAADGALGNLAILEWQLSDITYIFMYIYNI